ncbi:MAG: hypothetical protein ABSE70_10520, partial [Candidatus Limnocylindrales bacterium]
MAAEYNATVVSRVEVAPGLIILRVAPDKLPFEFRSGQYVVLGLKATEPRVEGAEADVPGVVASGAVESPWAGTAASPLAVAATGVTAAGVTAAASAVSPLAGTGIAGTPETVRQRTHEVLAIMAPGGGYV